MLACAGRNVSRGRNVPQAHMLAYAGRNVPRGRKLPQAGMYHGKNVSSHQRAMNEPYVARRLTGAHRIDKKTVYMCRWRRT